MSAATNASSDWDESTQRLHGSGSTCARLMGSASDLGECQVNGTTSAGSAGLLKSWDLPQVQISTSHPSTSLVACGEIGIASTRITGNDIEIGKAGLDHPPLASPSIVTTGDLSTYSRDPLEYSSKEISTMSNGFIKLQRSDLLIELFKKPNAFTLLAVIAYRARRTDCPITGLKSGEAMIGDYINYGMSRQQYRTALEHLESLKLVTINPTIKTTNGITTRATNKGTIVKIIDIRVYDINIGIDNHQDNHQSNQQKNPRATTNEEERSSKKVKELKNTECETQPKSGTSKAKRKISDDPLHFDWELKQFVGIIDEDKAIWNQAFPLVNLATFLPFVVIKVLSQRTRYQGIKNWRRNLNTQWLKREQDALASRGVRAAQTTSFDDLHDKLNTTKTWKIEVTADSVCFIALVGQTVPVVVKKVEVDRINKIMKEKGFT